ncbi:MAG TPA: hypothetical protein VFC84_15670 [Desulfosporosinus sp.]|nr:hypothetical protein [Desulfosporosinus sp.]
MTILLLVSRSVFIIAIVLYLYFFTQRKKHNVVLQMWISIIVGMLAGIMGQIIGVYLGDFSWSSIQFSMYLYAALILYSSWRLLSVFKKRSH